MRLKLIALVSAGIMTLAAFVGCTGGEGGNATSPAPTYSPVVTKAPDPRGTMPPASTAKAQIALDPTSTPSGIVPINKDALQTVVALATSTLAPTPTPTWASRPIKPTRIAIPTIPAIPTITFVTPTPWPTLALLPPTPVIKIPTRTPPSTLVIATRTSTPSTPTPSPTPQSLTVTEYIAWCSVNTSNDTTARVLGIDPNDFGDASTVTNGDMVVALEAHIQVVESVESPPTLERFHTAQRHWFEGMAGYYGGYPQSEYVDWWSLEQNLLEDAELSWRLLTLSTAIENLPTSIRNQITTKCFN